MASPTRAMFEDGCRRMWGSVQGVSSGCDLFGVAADCGWARGCGFCADSDDPWPIGSRRAFYNSSRNYFTGVMTPSAGAAPGPFYSVAELLEKARWMTVYSEVERAVPLYDGGGLKALAGSRDWGSDLVGVQSGCGAGAQLLATASGDATQDSLLAYEVQGRNAIAVSPPLPMDGRVMAMWPMISASGGGVPAVVTILKTEQPLQYEAYSVSVVCNQ